MLHCNSASVSLCNRRGGFQRGGEQVAPAGGADASASSLAEWSDWGVLVGMAGGLWTDE